MSSPGWQVKKKCIVDRFLPKLSISMHRENSTKTPSKHVAPFQLRKNKQKLNLNNPCNLTFYPPPHLPPSPPPTPPMPTTSTTIKRVREKKNTPLFRSNKSLPQALTNSCPGSKKSPPHVEQSWSHPSTSSGARWPRRSRPACLRW